MSSVIEPPGTAETLSVSDAGRLERHKGEDRRWPCHCETQLRDTAVLGNMFWHLISTCPNSSTLPLTLKLLFAVQVVRNMFMGFKLGSENIEPTCIFSKQKKLNVISYDRKQKLSLIDNG